MARPAHAPGFTLIELLAVLLIAGLLGGLVIPNLGATRTSALREEARKLAASLELARQRAVVTGIAHRLRLDPERGRYRVEWEVTQAEALRAVSGEPEAGPEAMRGDGEEEAEGRGVRELPDLSPPREQARSFHPLPGELGRATALTERVRIEAVEVGSRRIRGRDVFVPFDVDGTTEATRIRLRHVDGGALELEVRPLADAVRIVHDEG